VKQETGTRAKKGVAMRRLLLLTAALALITPAAHAEMHVGPGVSIDAPDTFSGGIPFGIDGSVFVEAAGLPLVEAAVGLPNLNVDLIVDGDVVAYTTTNGLGFYHFDWTFGYTPSTHTIRAVVFRSIPVLEISSRTVPTQIDRIITAITIAPAQPLVSLGGDLRLRACARDDDGRRLDVTDQAAWSSSDTAVATVSNVSGSRGLVSGVSVGTSTVSASFEGATGSTAVSVQEGSGSATIPCDTI
jgi:Big-like domain-containing protein